MCGGKLVLQISANEYSVIHETCVLTTVISCVYVGTNLNSQNSVLYLIKWPGSYSITYLIIRRWWSRVLLALVNLLGCQAVK